MSGEKSAFKVYLRNKYGINVIRPSRIRTITNGITLTYEGFSYSVDFQCVFPLLLFFSDKVHFDLKHSIKNALS